MISSVYLYDPQTARLVLQDRQASLTAVSVRPALVNIDNILENVSRELLEVGAWINVVGVLRGFEAEKRTSSKSHRTRTSKSKKSPSPVIDATMIWSAGAIKLEEYRTAVAAYQSAVAPA